MSDRTNASVFAFTTLLVALSPVLAMTQATPTGTGAGSVELLLSEARAFMAAYAADLQEGSRAKLAARYDSAGAYELRPGIMRYTSLDDLEARYATSWRKPATFEWRDLSYEAVGPDAVMVTGLFEWTADSGTVPKIQSYAALLRRHADGGLRIRLEAEAGMPDAPWTELAIIGTILLLLGIAIGWAAARYHYRRQRLAPGTPPRPMSPK